MLIDEKINNGDISYGNNIVYFVQRELCWNINKLRNRLGFVMAVNPLFDVDGVVPLMCPWSEKKEQSFSTSRRGTGVLEGKG